jgi:hypothetical protein
MKLIRVFLILLLCSNSLTAQTGGDNTYEFLNLTSSARVAALGNVLVNALDDDINLAQQLPSLNHAGMNGQFSANFTNYYAGVSFGSLVYGFSHSKFENISVGLQYLNYGDFIRTDAFGNSLGKFSAGEYAVYASTAIHHDSKYHVGAAVKGVYSSFEAYNSFGFLTDISASYQRNEGRFMTSLLMKNLGFQIKTYALEREPMPFEMVLGMSTRLEHAPFRWSITWSHLEKWDLSYANPQDQEIDPFTNELITTKYSIRDRIFSHLHIGGELLFSKNFNVRIGYNFRRRQELALDLYKHNVGLSWGLTMKVSKFHFDYARVAYHAVGPMHTFSLTSKLSNFKRK